MLLVLNNHKYRHVDSNGYNKSIENFKENIDLQFKVNPTIQLIQKYYNYSKNCTFGHSRNKDASGENRMVKVIFLWALAMFGTAEDVANDVYEKVKR